MYVFLPTAGVSDLQSSRVVCVASNPMMVVTMFELLACC